MTTLEVSNLGRYGFMGGRGGASLGQQMGHSHQHAGSDDTTGTGHHHHHKHGGICGGSGLIMNLLGFDRFTKGKAADGLARAARAPNPFHVGVMGNCKDFWTMGRELGVEYERLYDVPSEGFVEAKRRRVRDEGAGVGEDGGRKSLRQSLLMGLGLGRSANRGGYEPLSQV
jgi:palmitoyltransferase ZDHHC13/17